ncbi:hypothetical protein [Actinoplanes sp. G11-F43]
MSAASWPSPWFDRIVISQRLDDPRTAITQLERDLKIDRQP